MFDIVQVDLLLSFAEAAKGCTKDLSFDALVPCDSCCKASWSEKLKSCCIDIHAHTNEILFELNDTVNFIQSLLIVWLWETIWQLCYQNVEIKVQILIYLDLECTLSLLLMHRKIFFFKKNIYLCIHLLRITSFSLEMMNKNYQFSDGAKISLM